MSLTWWQQYWDDMDHWRLDAVEAQTHPDIVVRTGNNASVVGIENVMAGRRRFATQITSMQHEFVHIWVSDDTAVLESLVTYVRHDGSSVQLPCVSIAHRRDGLVDAVRVYIEQGPLFGEVVPERFAPLPQGPAEAGDLRDRA